MWVYRYLEAKHPPLKKGESLGNGRFEIVEDTFKKGGFGRIYKAIDRNDNTTVAIKEFYINELDYSINEQTAFSSCCSTMGIHGAATLMSERFKREALMNLIIGNDSRGHTPRLISDSLVFEENNTQYYVMSYVIGTSLREIVDDKGPMEEREAIALISSIGKELMRIHELGILHRDISPNNIICTKYLPKFILVDFGNARPYDWKKTFDYVRAERIDGFRAINYDYRQEIKKNGHEYEPDEDPYDAALHRIGTPLFMAPQKFDRTVQGDVFSLAATLFYALSGKYCRLIRENDKMIEVLKGNCISNPTIWALLRALTPTRNDYPTSINDFLDQLIGGTHITEWSLFPFNRLLYIRKYAHDSYWQHICRFN